MPTIYPSHRRPIAPTENSIQWTRPIRAGDVMLFGQAASTLLATRGMAQIVKHFEYWLLSDWQAVSNSPDGDTAELKIPIHSPHPLARQLIVAVSFYSKHGSSLVPSIKMKLTTMAGQKVDPQDNAGDDWAIEISESNGYIDQDSFKEGAEDELYRLRTAFCASGSENFPATNPTGPRRLNYGGQQDEPLLLTLETQSVRVITVSVFEAPRVSVEQ